MGSPKILLPYNFTEMDRKALAFFMKNFGLGKDCRITLLHIYAPLPPIETDSSTVMGRLSSSMQYLSAQQKEKEGALKEVGQYLVEQGIAAEQIDYVFRARAKQIADEIIDTAVEGRYEIIILNWRPYRVTRLFTQSVHNKILNALKDVMVCVVV